MKKKGAAGEREAEEGRALQEALLAALARIDSSRIFKSRPAFEAELDARLRDARVDVPAPARKAIVAALSERDESAEACTDGKGRPEPDSELRDYENVPLKEDIAVYFEREVKPHVADAWIAGVEIKNGRAIVVDAEKVRVGYEIPVTRHFYRYRPLRPLTVIEREIRLLEQEIQDTLGERLALITEAVTKGLDPSVPMKDSGIDWIGRIPSHWRIARIKHVARLESGHTPSRSVPEHWLDSNDIPWVSLNDTRWLAENDYISQTTYCINALGLQNSSARLLPARVVVFTRDATIGKAAITTRPMAVSQHLIAWVCGPKIVPEYLLRVFYAMEPALERYTFGATTRTIGMDDVRELVTPVPPLDEQHRSLGEYRQALITAAVTGKLEVAA